MCCGGGEGVSSSEVDYCDVCGVLGCDGAVIGGLGRGIEGVLGVLLTWSG
jgi:hypothetical protein